MATKMRQIGKLRQIVEEATTLEITHIHDDLVFVEHSALLLRFDDTDFDNFFLYFNPECNPSDKQKLIDGLTSTAISTGMRCTPAGQFKLSQVPDKEEVLIEFI